MRGHLHQHHHQQNQDTKKGNRRLFVSGTFLKERWEVEKLVAEGGFGQVFQAMDFMDGGRPVAVKAEAEDCLLPLLRMEVCVLKAINQGGRPLPHFLSLLGCGQHKNVNFIVMNLCGNNLMDLKKSTQEDCFSASTSLRLACQMLRALQNLHDIGWIHRDVKPSNFCLGREAENRRTVFLIDFGLCRQYLDSRRQHRPPRFKCGFRGTVRYASVNIHASKDQGRLDDLYSLFYIIVEQIKGQLPWRRISDKAKAREMKERTDFGQLLTDCPTSLRDMHQHLGLLNYYSRPDYEALANCFQRDLGILGVCTCDPFDWESSGDFNPAPIKTARKQCPGTPCPSLYEQP